ncbi:winged helix-turn-helix domain-containing protein [Streptomyces meridianus]|uniref:GntR family transcriptional regulator n=1 Tax=Streptomyces meridianus TaxID=2938945 RepID=A0ABT0X458_9ACTN|nr:GntR family transcriptional regulator [Streptomyces meridianus]MCM2577317.1 GntR family transcriptional regulator [Streptomyces meridianus]
MAATERTASGETKFEHVVKVLRAEIADGTYAPGTRIPTQRALVDRFAVSRDTVRRALDDLKSKGLIETRQGSGAVVARTHDDHMKQPQAMVHLRPYIARAFEEPEVTLDLISLTSESIDAHIRAQILRIQDGEIRPRRISVRILLPSADITLAFPRAVADPGDPRPRNRHRALMERHAGSVRDALLDLKSRRLVDEVSVEVRTMPLTPIAKLYLINGKHALFGMYPVEERPARLHAKNGGGYEEVEILDSLGVGMTLFPFSLSETAATTQQSVFVREAQRWFDSLWDHLADEAEFGI